MKAVVFHKYGGPDELKYEDFPDPVAGEGEVLVRVSAVSINPFDYKIRSGQVKDVLPVQFPAILGIDVSGVVEKVGPSVESFAPGDKVFALASKTYAQLCVVKAADLARIPEGMHIDETAALPLVTLTGEQLISVGTAVKQGDTVLVSGAAGNVGRSAVFTAKKRGAKVIAGVLRRQLNEAQSIRADEIVALDDDLDLDKVKFVDAVADTVGGKTAEKLITKVKDGGVFATVLGAPGNAGQCPSVRVVPVYSTADAAAMVSLAEAVNAGELEIPIGRKLALKDAAEGHAAVEQGGVKGKVLLLT